MKEIKNSYDISGIKRCYFPGMKIEIECPNCGKKLVRDFDDTYIRYPNLGLNVVNFICGRHTDGGCEKEFSLEINISTEIKITYDESDLKEIKE